MKNGLFNLIRGIAFCFVLSIICLFGRVDVKADTVSPNDVFYAFSIACENNSSPSDEVINRIKTYTNYTHWIAFAYTEGSATYLCIGGTNQKVYDFDPNTEAWCMEKGYTYLTDGFFLDGSIVKYKRTCDSSPQWLDTTPRIKCDSNGFSLFNSNMGHGYFNNPRIIATYKSVHVKKNEPQYDSSLGYLSNVKVKRASPFLATDLSTDFTNIIDRFSWGAVTSGGSSLDGVDIRIKAFKNANILEEVETHIDCPSNNYNFDWADYIDLSLKDWVDTNQYKYEIFMRPTLGDKYGDYCFVSSVLPNDYDSRVDSSKASQFLTDTVQYKENVGNIEDFTSFAIPEDTQTLYVANYVTSNKTIDELESYLNSNIIPDSSLTLEDLKNNSVSAESSSSVKYILDINNTYKVLIPKSIELTPDSEGNYTAEYNVKLSNFDIMHNKIVKILSPESVEITRNGTNYKVTSFNDLNKDVEGNQDTIAVEGKGNEKIFTGYINAGKLVSGTWNAKLTFTITLETN